MPVFAQPFGSPAPEEGGLRAWEPHCTAPHGQEEAGREQKHRAQAWLCRARAVSPAARPVEESVYMCQCSANALEVLCICRSWKFVSLL